MNFQEWLQQKLALWIYGENIHKDINIIERKQRMQFDPNNPLVDQGYQIQVNDPNSLNDIAVTQVLVLSCGHCVEDPSEIVECSCGRSFCRNNCATRRVRNCWRCNAPIASCCWHHSIGSFRMYCGDCWRWYYGILGR